MAWPRTAAPMSSCSTYEGSPMKRRNPRNGADITASSRKHRPFQSCFAKQKGSEGAYLPRSLWKTRSARCPTAFCANCSPFWCFSFPVESEERTQYAAPLCLHTPLVLKSWVGAEQLQLYLSFYLLFFFLFNKPKKAAKKCKELHSLQNQVRRCRGDLRFGSRTLQYCSGLTVF